MPTFVKNNSFMVVAAVYDVNILLHFSFVSLFLVFFKKNLFLIIFILFSKRSVGKTQMNEQSSRSHFVFTLRISGVNEV